MSLCVVNYPSINSRDFEWIQSIRRQHDHLFFNIVRPHFTMVFPTNDVEESTLIEHVTQILSEFKGFDAVLRCAIIGDPSFMDHAHVFLMPDEGFGNLVRLHDKLYTGILERELRLDLPFIPHIGVASVPSLKESKAIVDKLNKEEFAVRCRIDSLDVIGYEGKNTWNIKTCSFATSEA